MTLAERLSNFDLTFSAISFTLENRIDFYSCV